MVINVKLYISILPAAVLVNDVLANDVTRSVESGHAPVSHWLPVKPSTHTHWKAASWSKHVALLLHGSELHSSISGTLMITIFTHRKQTNVLHLSRNNLAVT